MTNEAPVTAAEALIEITKAYRAFKAFEHAHKALTALASTEQATREAEQRRVVLLAEEEALLSHLEALRAEGEQAQADAQAGVLKAKEDGLALLQDAEAKADKILLAAEEQAAGIVATAETRANTVLGEAAEYERRRDAAAAELIDIEARLQAAREAFQRALSGA